MADECYHEDRNKLRTVCNNYYRAFIHAELLPMFGKGTFVVILGKDLSLILEEWIKAN